MDIQDAPREGIEKRFLDDTHESCKHNEIDLSLSEQLDDFSLGFRRHLGSERTRGNKVTGNFKFPPEIQDAGVLQIGEDNHRLSAEGPGPKYLRKGPEIGSLSRTKNAESYHRRIRGIL